MNLWLLVIVLGFALAVALIVAFLLFRENCCLATQNAHLIAEMRRREEQAQQVEAAMAGALTNMVCMCDADK